MKAKMYPHNLLEIMRKYENGIAGLTNHIDNKDFAEELRERGKKSLLNFEGGEDIVKALRW